MNATMSAQQDKLAVVVTGASAGIGQAVAQVAGREGGAIVLVGRTSEGLGNAAEEVRRAGGEPFTLELDLLARDAPTRLEDFLLENRLICDVLVNSAGYGLRGAATSLPIGEQLGIVDLNIRALSELTLRFLPGMVERHRGGVINFSSVAGFAPGPYMACYYASKSFVRSFSEALYQEVRRTGVTVTCVAPGPVRTNFLAESGAKHVPLFQLLPTLSSVYVAESAWRGFKTGRRLVVPGVASKLAALMATLTPSALMLPLVGKLQRSGNDPCPCGSGKKFKNCCNARHRASPDDVGRVERPDSYS